MLLNVVAGILLLLFASTDCRAHHRHRFMREGNRPLFQFVGQAFEYPSSPAQSPRTESPLNSNPYAANANPAKQMSYPPQSQPFQQFQRPAQPQMSLTTVPQAVGTYPIQQPYLPYTSNRSLRMMYSGKNPNYQPIFSSKRRKKNVQEKKSEMVELLESGKELLELSSTNGKEGYDVIGENSSSTVDDINSNVTFFPIPRGMQLKSFSKQGDRKVDSTVNLTSSTERIITIDNSTEIENVVEMQMEKKIEDGKGANKGSEEVRIVQTEHIKPMFHRKLNKFHVHKRRRKSYINVRTMARRRRKRSGQAQEIKSDSIFDKMAKTFLTTISRKERIVKSNDLNERDIPNDKFDQIVRESSSQDKYDSAHHRLLVNEFIKFFFQEIGKIKKLQENSKNHSKPMMHSNEVEIIPNSTALKKKGKKAHKGEDYPEHLNVAMKMNMMWESKVKKPVHKSKRYFDKTIAPPNVLSEVSPTQGQIALLIFSNGTDYRFLHIVSLVASMAFFVAAAMWMVPNFCRIRRIIPPPTMKGYGFYRGGQKNKILELVDYSDKKEYCFTEDYPKLEWQLENGDWLSE